LRRSRLNGHDAANLSDKTPEDGAGGRRKDCDAVLNKLALGNPPHRSLEDRP